jgi:G3E family GTPase
MLVALRVPLCLVCREDLVNALNKLYERREQIDHIIIETTGLANPGPIVSSFYMDRWGSLWSCVCLARVGTLMLVVTAVWRCNASLS